MLGVVTITEPVYFPRGAADPAGRTGYLAVDSGIVAVDLSAGRELWRSDRAQRPLLVAGERPVAARVAEDPRVVLLDERGEPALTSDPVPFPAADAVKLTSRLEDGRLVLEWEGGGYAGGAPPPPEIREQAGGAAAVDLESGAVEPLPAPANDGIRRPPVDDLEGPWLAGDTVVELVWDEQALWLRIGDGNVELARGDTVSAEPTADGLHLLVREGDRWHCVSAETGRREATLTYEPGAHEPAVVERRVYYLLDRGGTRVLKARDLDTDTVAWELVVGERRPSGPPRLRQ
jgi:hypothetical protein